MERSRNQSYWTVNLYLLPIKIHYFIFEFALACALPYRTVFAKQLGVSATAVGIIFFAVPFIKILTNPLFGFILDYFKRFRLTLCVVMVCVALSHVALVFIPPVKRLALISANSSTSFRANFQYNCTENGSPVLDPRKMQGFIQNLMCSELPDIDFQVQCNFCNSSDSVRNVDRNQSFTCKSDCKEHYRTLFFTMHAKTIISKFPQNNLAQKSHLIESENKTHQNDRMKLNKANSTETYDRIDINDTQISKLHLENNQLHDFYAISYGNTTDLCTNCPWNHLLECKAYVIGIYPENVCKSPTSEDETSSLFSVQFCSLFVLMVISSISFVAVMFLMDAVCYEMLDPHKEKFGAQRMWATIGWGLGALTGGFLNQIMSDDPNNIDYGPSFYLLAALIILDLIPLSKIELTNVKYSLNICKDVGSLLCNLQFVIYILMVLGVGVLSGLIWNYQFWFMQEIGASQTLLGLSNTFECLVAEVPCFILSGWIIRKIGHFNCLNITFLCFGLRYLCFAYMKNPWWSLPAGLFHGPTFGLFFASMTMFGKTEAPAGTEASIQAFLALAFEGIGVGAGSVLGGFGIDRIGSQNTFMCSAMASFVLLFINIVLQVCMKMCRKPSLPTEIKTNSHVLM